MIMNTSRIMVSRTSTAMTRRAFSNCEPVERIRCVLEEYRQANFLDDTPSRFKKNVIKAAQCPKSGVIEISSLNQILENIGRPDACLSKEDQNLVLKEAGVDDRYIPVSKMLQMF